MRQIIKYDFYIKVYKNLFLDRIFLSLIRRFLWKEKLELYSMVLEK